jgi:hypothetical protein
MHGYDFHRQNRLIIIFLDFFVTGDARDWSRWLFSWVLEVYKDTIKEKTNDGLELHSLRFDNKFFEIWKM